MTKQEKIAYIKYLKHRNDEFNKIIDTCEKEISNMENELSELRKELDWYRKYSEINRQKIEEIESEGINYD